MYYKMLYILWLHRLQVVMMNGDKQWQVKSYLLPVEQWVTVDVSYSEYDGVQLYVDDKIEDQDTASEPRQQRVSLDW